MEKEWGDGKEGKDGAGGERIERKGYGERMGRGMEKDGVRRTKGRMEGGGEWREKDMEREKGEGV